MSESEDLLLTEGPNTFTGEVVLRAALGPGGEDVAKLSSGTGEL